MGETGLTGEEDWRQSTTSTWGGAGGTARAHSAGVRGAERRPREHGELTLRRCCQLGKGGVRWRMEGRGGRSGK
ncbi:vegetative cell wall protein gp1-like [Iris pallida]|uniref:Vegetative cell wall protein gp1-like n=1 Tax=Iris pallida TaxID=29817 RepID=A0AAX6FTV5_IRIPA|nr:vegetative cell wall protein gp1-like [Iris pallida]